MEFTGQRTDLKKTRAVQVPMLGTQAIKSANNPSRLQREVKVQHRGRGPIKETHRTLVLEAVVRTTSLKMQWLDKELLTAEETSQHSLNSVRTPCQVVVQWCTRTRDLLSSSRCTKTPGTRFRTLNTPITRPSNKTKTKILTWKSWRISKERFNFISRLISRRPHSHSRQTQRRKEEHLLSPDTPKDLHPLRVANRRQRTQDKVVYLLQEVVNNERTTSYDLNFSA